MIVYFTLFFVRITQNNDKESIHGRFGPQNPTTAGGKCAYARLRTSPSGFSLTSPAVSSRIHRLEQEGVIGGYTVVLRHPDAPARVEALISVLVDAATRASFLTMIEQEPQVLQCFRVTGSYNL